METFIQDVYTTNETPHAQIWQGFVTDEKHAGSTLLRMEFFGAAHRCGGGDKKAPLPKICHTYPTMMKLGTVIPYPKNIQKIYERRGTLLEFS